MPSHRKGIVAEPYSSHRPRVDRCARPGIGHRDDSRRGVCVAVGRKVFRAAFARNHHSLHAQSPRGPAGTDQDPSDGGCQHGNAGRSMRKRLGDDSTARPGGVHSRSTACSSEQIVQRPPQHGERAGQHRAESTSRCARDRTGHQPGNGQPLPAQASGDAHRHRSAQVEAG